MEVKVGKIDLEAPKGSGAILVKNLYLSCDPYMRGRMREFYGSYIQPFVPGQVNLDPVPSVISFTQLVYLVGEVCCLPLFGNFSLSLKNLYHIWSFRWLFLFMSLLMDIQLANGHRHIEDAYESLYRRMRVNEWSWKWKFLTFRVHEYVNFPFESPSEVRNANSLASIWWDDWRANMIRCVIYHYGCTNWIMDQLMSMRSRQGPILCVLCVSSLKLWQFLYELHGSPCL